MDWKSLPADLIILVIQWLDDDIVSVSRLSRVNKAIQKIADGNEVWEPIFEKRNGNLNITVKSFKNEYKLSLLGNWSPPPSDFFKKNQKKNTKKI